MKQKKTVALLLLLIFAVSALGYYQIRKGEAEGPKETPQAEEKLSLNLDIFDPKEIFDPKTLEMRFATQEEEKSRGVIINVTVVSFHSIDWMGNKWYHRGVIFQPVGRKSEYAAIVFGGMGGEPESFLEEFGLKAAAEAGIPVFIVTDVPFMPQFGIKDEEELLTFSLEKYFETGDIRWPLPYPMAAAYMRAATLLNYLLNSHPTKFILSGGSKRGWASCIAAAADPRVVAIAPRSFAGFDLEALIDTHLEVYGELKGSLKSLYTSRLIEKINTSLWDDFVKYYDPINVMKRKDLRVMLLVGTNDALNPLSIEGTYQETYPGKLYVAYVPSASHTSLHSSIEAEIAWRMFLKHIVLGEPIPEVTSIDTLSSNGKIDFSVKIDDNGAAIDRIELWYAYSKTKDFTQVKWNSVMMSENRKIYTATISSKEGEFVGIFVAVWPTSAGIMGYVTSSAMILGG